MTDYTTRALDASTWDAFADLAERNNGVWGGCWCIWFHPESKGMDSAAESRAAKEARVRSGDAHAALVFDGDEAVGWCQFGSPEEVSRIKFRKAYEAETTRLPDWRITCFFVDKRHRRQGVAAAALAGALDQIATLGGGVVEAMPEDTSGRKAQGSFLFTGILSLFEDHGFTRQRQLGKHAWLVSKQVAAK